MNISFSRILPVYDCIHNADISELVSPQCGVESKRPRNQERDVVPCTKVQVSFEDPLWFMHKRHSLQVEGARGGGIPQLQISASKYEVADAPNPPTPQICAHQKSKNWRRSPCSVYCKPSPKNSRQLEMVYMKRWGTPSDQMKTQTCQKLYLRTTTIVQEDPGNGSLSKYENRSPLHRKKSSPHE